MISSDENIADRPIRNHFNKIIFSTLGFMVFAVLLAILFFHFKQPKMAPTPKTTGAPPTTSTQPQ